MISHEDLMLARDRLLKRAVSFFTEQPDVTGILLAGSLAAGTSDPYSDIDLRIIATPDGQARLATGRLEWPSHWGDLLFNEWLNGTQHCVSHFRPFLKLDVFYWSPDTFVPSAWFRMPATVFLDRDGLVGRVLAASASLDFEPPTGSEVSRVLSKALAGAHEVVRRTRRGELHFAQSLLDELRSHMVQLDMWLHAPPPKAPADLKLPTRISPTMREALRPSYVGLDARQLEEAVIALGSILERQIPDLHQAFALQRSPACDLEAIRLVTMRQVA